MTPEELRLALVDVVTTLDGLEKAAESNCLYKVQSDIEKACTRLVAAVAHITSSEITGGV